jgi:hypothetical protein
MRSIAVALLLHVAVAARASAQSPAEPHAYVGGGLAVAWQPEEFADGHYLLSSTLGGVSAGPHIQAGVHVNRTVSLAAEFSMPMSLHGERVRYVGSGYTHESGEHRETIISVLNRFHFARGAWEFQPAWGVGWARTRTETEGVLRTAGEMSVPLTPYTDTDTRMGLTGGLDVVRQFSGGFGVAPFFRLHWIRRPDSPEETTDGLPEVVYRGGVLLVARF